MGDGGDVHARHNLHIDKAQADPKRDAAVSFR
jgi:hypothetical protein